MDFHKLWSRFKFKNDEGKPTKLAYMTLIGLLGLLFLIAGNFFQQDETVQDSPLFTEDQPLAQPDQETFSQKGDGNEQIISEMEEVFEKELKEILEKIEGVSQVDVMVNLDATKLKIYEKNTIVGKQTTNETDQKGGKRQIEDYSQEEQTVIIRNQNQEMPLLIQTKKPAVRGVLIVARGAENIQIKKRIVEAVSSVLDAPTHRISVMPKD
ncbi:MAG: stage III sporulation protein AG [Bacillaceae bacterium]|nr:stage III sporulation protein AG [Bacillaceae bacterium]